MRAVERTWPPAPGEPVNKFNQFERNMMQRVVTIEKQLKVDQRLILKPTQEKPGMKPLRQRQAPQAQKTDAEKVIDQGIEMYKGGFKTSIRENVGISTAALNAMKKQKLEELVGKFKAVSPTLYYAEGRISFLLSIVEDAVSKVQSGGTSPCDQVLF